MPITASSKTGRMSNSTQDGHLPDKENLELSIRKEPCEGEQGIETDGLGWLRSQPNSKSPSPMDTVMAVTVW